VSVTYEAFDESLTALRPRLHRYCARMTGSAIDGEDVVQDALLKATASLHRSERIGNIESWLFRIAHNAAIDFLRKRSRAEAARSDEDPDMLGDLERPVDDRDIVAASLATFMRLPAMQRSAVILMDVLQYPLAEICTIVDASLPAVKSALHRGRLRLKELAREPGERPVPVWSQTERALLERYVERFNARDFDAIRDTLAQEVKLDLVGKVRREGKAEVSVYFENYSRSDDWEFSLGLVDRRPAIVVRDARDVSAGPVYFVVIDWDGDRVLNIRDFRYARYVVEAADIA
jgi:RNA polymerase sigma-70 factor (ECF subfamily)